MAFKKHSEESKRKIGEANKIALLGNIPWNKGLKTGLIPKTAFKDGHTPWSKTQKGKTLNTGRTHFKKGQIPWNYKGGVTKTIEYRNFYKRRYKTQKMNALGNHTFVQWIALKEKYLNMCLCCKQFEPVIKLTQDHIIPLSMGGSDKIDNIQPLCVSCNSRKHTQTINYMIGTKLHVN